MLQLDCLQKVSEKLAISSPFSPRARSPLYCRFRSPTPIHWGKEHSERACFWGLETYSRNLLLGNKPPQIYDVKQPFYHACRLCGPGIQTRHSAPACMGPQWEDLNDWQWLIRLRAGITHLHVWCLSWEDSKAGLSWECQLEPFHVTWAYHSMRAEFQKWACRRARILKSQKLLGLCWPHYQGQVVSLPPHFTGHKWVKEVSPDSRGGELDSTSLNRVVTHYIAEKHTGPQANKGHLQKTDN